MFTKDESPLKFWNIKANKYPILSTIAKNNWEFQQHLRHLSVYSAIVAMFPDQVDVHYYQKKFERLIYFKINAGEL